MLAGKNVNLRVMEKEDLPLWADWNNDPEVMGKFASPVQTSMAETEKSILEPGPHEFKPFMIEKKDGAKIGSIGYFYTLHPAGKMLEIGFGMVPSERGKGYCTEAAQIMVDYLFLSKETPFIQATADIENIASQRVLQKVGFKNEGTMRKRSFVKGEWRDLALFSILREEWAGPKILK
jgi:RimJ/RimL family protein N-acetyltransferase